MPIEIILDTWDDSSLEVQGTFRRHTRGGRAIGIPTTLDSVDALAYVTLAPGMPLLGSTHPSQPTMTLVGLRVYGISSDSARFQLIYETATGMTPSSYIIDVSSALSTFATNLMPGTRQAIKADFIPSGPNAANGERLDFDFVTVNMLRPLRRISVTQLQQGDLTEQEAVSFSDNVGKVNDAVWMGKPSGSWIISGATASVSRYSGFFQKRIEAMSQGDDLWIYFGILRSQATGKYATDENTDSAINTLKALPYTAKTVSPGNGLVRVDPYDVIAFAPIFGF